MQFGIITLFPELLNAFLKAGVIGRAVESRKIAVKLINPRDFTTDLHKTVDDRPFGGGPGMVMKAEPLIAAIESAKADMPLAKTVYLSPQGVPLTQVKLRQWAGSVNLGGSDEPINANDHDGLILIAGRYEGIDERVIESHVDEEISIGDFVLRGGEVAAMVVVDALSRLIPGVLGHPLSAAEDSFGEDGLLDHPHYTRPEVLGELGNRGRPGKQSIPAVLKSGDHKAIAEWRRQMAVKRTWERRPELLSKATLTAADRQVLEKLNGGHDDKPSGSTQ